MDNIDISFGDDVLIGHGNGVTIDDHNDNVISSETLVGPQGPPGPAGYSPTANVTQTQDGAIIRITDEKGTTTANVHNGTDGVSPTATVTGTASGATITITDANGTTTATVNNGEDGEPGDNATISIGQVSTLAPGSQATVSNVGTATNAVLDFGIPEGQQGIQGIQGLPGINAQAYVTQNTGSATITIEDADGITTATVYDGQDGTNGQDGYSPTATVTQNTGSATISITDQNGTTTATVYDGQNGTNGTDGISPVATVTPTASGATISITDAQGTTTANITNGTDGTDGTDGVTPVISATASVDSTTGTPSVTVTKSGSDVTPSFSFAFTGLKGEPGTTPSIPGVWLHVISNWGSQGWNTFQLVTDCPWSEINTATKIAKWLWDHGNSSDIYARIPCTGTNPSRGGTSIGIYASNATTLNDSTGQYTFANAHVYSVKLI